MRLGKPRDLVPVGRAAGDPNPDGLREARDLEGEREAAGGQGDEEVLRGTRGNRGALREGDREFPERRLGLEDLRLWFGGLFLGCLRSELSVPSPEEPAENRA